MVSSNTQRLVRICAGVKVGFEGFRQLSITQHEKMEFQLKRIEETQRKCMDMVPVASLSVGRYIEKLGTRLEKLIEYFRGFTAEILQILRRMIRTDLEMYTLLRQIMDELPQAPDFQRKIASTLLTYSAGTSYCPTSGSRIRMYLSLC